MTVLADVCLPVALVEGQRLHVHGMELRVRVSARRTRFALTVETDGGATLHVPRGRARADAEVFVLAHRTWLREKLAVRERTRPLNPAKRLVEGEVFRYLGRTYRLSLAAEAAEDGRVRLISGRLVMGREQAGDPALGRAALVRWYSRAGRVWAEGRLQPWAARMAVAEPAFDVRGLGQRWGTYRPASTVEIGRAHV